MGRVGGGGSDTLSVVIEILLILVSAVAFLSVALIAALVLLRRHRKKTGRDQPSGVVQFWGWSAVVVASLSYPVLYAFGKPNAAIAIALLIGAVLQLVAILERVEEKDELLVARKEDRDLLESLGWSIIIAASAGAVLVEFF